MHNTLPRIQAHRSNSTDSQALFFWRRGCANMTPHDPHDSSRASVVSDKKPERRTRINTKPPPPLPSFQHDILVPISFEGVSCWAGEENREEASTRALFPEKHTRKPRVSRRRKPINCSLIFKQRRAQYRGREGERTHHVVFRVIMGRGRKFSRSRKTSVHFSNFVIRRL